MMMNTNKAVLLVNREKAAKETAMKQVRSEKQAMFQKRRDIACMVVCAVVVTLVVFGYLHASTFDFNSGVGL